MYDYPASAETTQSVTLFVKTFFFYNRLDLSKNSFKSETNIYIQVITRSLEKNNRSKMKDQKKDSS